MILGFEEAKDIDGRFIEFAYMIKIKRCEKTENFKCFQGNELEIFEYEDTKFFRNESDALHIIDAWRSDGVYSYVLMGAVSKKSYSAEEVISLKYQRNNFKYLSYFTTVGSIDYIS